MSAITAKASRKMKKYAVLTREPRCFLGSFDFSWEQRKVSDLAEKTYGGGTPTTSNEAYWNGDIPWIQSSDVVDGKLLGVEPRKWITQDGLNNSAAQLIPGNSIAIITRVGVGKLAFMPYSYATSQDFLSLSKLNAEPLFTVYACYKKLQSELNAVQGTSIKGITKDELLAKNIMVPRYAEQQQIGAFFKQLDHLITLHQRKCALLFSSFQALISMMFTTSTFSWEQRKLGDIADIVGGGTPSTGNQSYWDGDIDWYAPAEIADQIYANSSQKKITGLGYENSSAKMLPPGTVLFTSRAGIGKTAILTRKGCTNQGFQSIVPHRGELDSYFIFSRTEELKRYGELVGAGSTFVEVSGKQMAVMELMMPPTMREQQTIGGFFQQLDHLITLHQRKCISFTVRAGRLISTVNKKRITSSWEQRKAIDIADYSKGNGYSKGDLTDSGTPIILYGRLYTKYQFAISEVDTFAVPRNGAVYSQGNEVIVPASGETAEDIARASAVEESGVLLGGDLNILRPFDFINPLFLALAISNGEPQKELAKKAQGKSVVHIHNTDIQEVTIAYPSRTEQDRIVSVFRQLDNLITLHQRKPFLMKWRTSDANRNQTNRLVL